jgi:hypothetical protein
MIQVCYQMPKKRRNAVADVGAIIARMLCDDANCVGDVGKYGSYYITYIGKLLLKKSVDSNFIANWDRAIVEQMQGKGVQTVDELLESPYYQQVTKARQAWATEAKKMGFDDWKQMVTEKLEEKGMTTRDIRAKIRGLTELKELQLKF